MMSSDMSSLMGAGLAAGISGISLKLRPGISKPGIWGICIPLMGGIPPPINLDIMSSIPRDFISPIPPIILGMPPMPIPPIIGGIGPPDDIIVEDDEDEEDDLKLEIVDPSSDCVVAAIL